MTPEFTKVEIKLHVSANDQEVEVLNKNIKAVQHLIKLVALAGVLNNLDLHLRMPASLFAMADVDVVRTEPNQQTQAE